MCLQRKQYNIQRCAIKKPMHHKKIFISIFMLLFLLLAFLFLLQTVMK